MKVIGFLSCLALSCLVLSVFFVSSAKETLPYSNVPTPDLTTFESEPNDFPDGSFTDWSTSGLAPVDANGYSQSGTLVLVGGETKDLYVKVRLRAVIGVLQKELPEIEMVVLSGRQSSIPVDFRSALNMHERQYEYTTRIEGVVEVSPNDDRDKKTLQYIESRYLAYNEMGGYFEVMDFDTREKVYPFGLTTEKGQQEARELVAQAEAEGEHLESIGSGVYKKEPSGQLTGREE
jgi:hypothetical protein